MKPTFRSVTPLLPAGHNLAAALSFYVDQLGFTIQWQSGNSAGIARDAIAFTLIESDNQNWLENTSLSIGVSDLDALYTEYRNIATPARVGPLETKPWGRREFHLIEPAGVCFQFYQQ